MNNQLYLHPLFTVRSELLSPDEQVSLSYQRAKLVMQTYRLTAQDIQFCTPRFWALICDPILSLDIAMFTILAAHIGLAIGTLSCHLKARPDLRPLVQRLLRFETVGLYLLTERGHGLDSFNIETTATKTPDGYILHTPREEAAKFMPASTPKFNIPKVALVMARLIVEGEDRGCRFFVVPICNEKEMFHGVQSTRLPTRSGTGPLDFSITTFNQVHLPPTALVASDISNISKPARPLEAWWNEIWRIQLGTMAVPAPWITAIKSVAFIGGRYSMRRCILGKNNDPVPIITFRTQQWPVAHATAVGMVMANWFPTAVQEAMANSDHRLRHAMSVVIKTTNDGKGVIIAEGDVLTLCIRLFSELLQGHFELPLPDPSESLLAHHAASILQENHDLFLSLNCEHRSDSFNFLILPQSEKVVEAIGHALAYSAAVKSGLPKPILDVYESAIIRQDPAWYSEQGSLTRMEQRVREDAAISSFMVHLDDFLDQLDVENYVSAPIVSDHAWKSYLEGLTTYSGNAVPSVERLQAVL
ncbi:hypothetical protein CVT25_005159 [Psilocybe cyanescens]|uniref:Acyl-CoA oxidase n=1 Tax=Psilocybe cyanescens TaxID=93625 RepID=A0A409XBT7_PSICY|nr:hypothetical protein CVT25_005159 [Psilocybe cyanescens]